MGDRLELPATAEVVIVGAGVIGSSIAFHLATRGMTDVVVLERDEIASGATSKATGGIRQQFSSEADISLSLESVRFYATFDERVGYPFSFRQIGYLFLVSDPAQLAVFRRNAGLQNRLGVPTEILSVDAVAARFPAIATEGLVGASFCPTDGSGVPADATYGFARRARDLGVRIVERTEVTGIETERGTVTGVRTPRGRVATGTVIIAAGPWAAPVAKLAGLSLPVLPVPRQAFTATPVAALGANFPFAIDMESGVYVHQEPSLIVLGGGDRARPSSFEPTIDWSRFEYVVSAAIRRVPALEEAGSISGWCGLREMTPDDHAILGPAPTPRGLWSAVGFSGHGFMHAPAIGRIMAEWLVDGSPTGIDVASFALERFDAERLSRGAEQLVF